VGVSVEGQAEALGAPEDPLTVEESVEVGAAGAADMAVGEGDTGEGNSQE
jgi:hypothetical protein